MSDIRADKLKDVALDLISRIYYYGNFKIETVNERTLAGILNELGLFPTSEQEIMGRPDNEELHQRYKDFVLP